MGDIEIYPVAESPSFSGIFLPTAFWCLFLFFFLCPLQSRHICPSLYCCSQSGTIRETFVLHAALSNVRSSLCPCQGCQCQLGLTFISATRFCVITSFSSGVAEGNTLSVHTQFWRMLADSLSPGPGQLWFELLMDVSPPWGVSLEGHSKGSCSSPWKLPSILLLHELAL